MTYDGVEEDSKNIYRPTWQTGSSFITGNDVNKFPSDKCILFDRLYTSKWRAQCPSLLKIFQLILYSLYLISIREFRIS